MTETEESFDVVIIGAGPAGLAAAAVLAGSDKKVLMLEQKEIIGPKICAGGLTRKDLDHIKIPERLLDRRFKELDFHSPRAVTTARYDHDMISTIDRKKFADWQLEKLANRGNVEIRTGSKAMTIDKEKVTLDDASSVKYEYLIGADGSFSAVRRFLKIETEDTAIAIQYIIPTDAYKKLEFFFDSKLFGAWYAWIFPHDGYASIGCMCDPRDLSAKALQQNFDTWLRRNDIDVSNGKFEGYAINYDYRGFKFGKVFLAGDAAGLASGFTGEGIYQAIVSGEDAAKSILDGNYEAVGIKGLLETKRAQNRLMKNLIKAGVLRNLCFDAIVFGIRNPKIAGQFAKFAS